MGTLQIQKRLQRPVIRRRLSIKIKILRFLGIVFENNSEKEMMEGVNTLG